MVITEEMINKELEGKFMGIEDVDVPRILELFVKPKEIEKDATC